MWDAEAGPRPRRRGTTKGNPKGARVLATTKVGSTWWGAQSWETPMTGMQLESGTHEAPGTEVGRLTACPFVLRPETKIDLWESGCCVCEPGDWQSEDL